MGLLAMFDNQPERTRIDLGHAFVLVDVETTGLYWTSDRVVQVAIRLLDRYGTVEHSWSTLVHPERDPGPTHIHGITADMLIDAPTFAAVAQAVAEMFDDRVVVAHNAGFDWGFISAECNRSATVLNSTHRLCTLALARRLDLDVPDFKLDTLAAWAGVVHARSHDAAADAEVLEVVFRKLVELARRGGVALPLKEITAPTKLPWSAAAPVVDSPWARPAPWDGSAPLTQGAKFVVTGGTHVSRAELYARAVTAGLVPMNSVSRRTDLVVCNDAAIATGKVRTGLSLGLPVIDEERFLTLLGHVRPGTGRVVPVASPTPVGPLRGCRVLVIGGPHDVAVRVRDEVARRGGRVAVNLTPTVSHVVALAAAESDPRWSKTLLLRRLDPHSLTEPTASVAVDPPPVASSTAVRSIVSTIMRRGQVIDLPASPTRWELFVSWTLNDPPLELDVFAFITDEREKVLSDDHFVFFNALRSPGGGVELDLENDGENRLAIDLDELALPGVQLIVGASLGGDHRFGDVGPVELVLRDLDGAVWARAVLDAGTTENSLVLATFYQRGDGWRLRAVGQGYEEPLTEFAVRHGVVVDG